MFNISVEEESDLVKLERYIAQKKIENREIRERIKISEQRIDNFLERRRQIHDTALKALEYAMERGDVQIAEIASKILQNEFEQNIEDVIKNSYRI